MMRPLLAVLATLCTCAMLVAPASADWRWADPSIKQPKPHVGNCKTKQCKQKAKRISVLKYKLKKAKYSYNKEREWQRWISQYIPRCTWYGESGPGPEFAQWRYTLRNGGSHGPPIEDVAHGKFQFKPATYRTRAKYFDWSPLDQEIAARREYWAHGTSPWEGCH